MDKDKSNNSRQSMTYEAFENIVGEEYLVKFDTIDSRIEENHQDFLKLFQIWRYFKKDQNNINETDQGQIDKKIENTAHANEIKEQVNNKEENKRNRIDTDESKQEQNSNKKQNNKDFHVQCIPQKHRDHVPCEDDNDPFLCHICYKEESETGEDKEIEHEGNKDIDNPFETYKEESDNKNESEEEKSSI
ncbi:hypothetical protein ILUMI_19655 [Ignelater luminosus]|uniref:Uncharacterized protein n=1 Tax=Ignelater luminosus TaxID=2038154 RepID=A0A8K0G5D5_IGNLU|nr:hypothetical protein ILUMI_19655 [Ignelater luminosus]